jgi:hypothetical protein
MKYNVARLTIGVIFTMVLIGFGCSVAVYEYTSSPESKKIETPNAIVSFTPSREDTGYFSSFLLEIENRTDGSMEIDWNKTLYLHEQKNRGGFVFEGIEPAQVREKSLPNGVIPPQTLFSIKIFPLAKIAMAERKDYSAGKDKPGLYGGKLPPGENSILLVIQENGQWIRKKISVVISEQAK